MSRSSQVAETSRSTERTAPLSSGRFIRAGMTILATSAALLAAGCGSKNIEPKTKISPAVRAYLLSPDRNQRITEAEKKAGGLLVKVFFSHTPRRIMPLNTSGAGCEDDLVVSIGQGGVGFRANKPQRSCDLEFYTPDPSSNDERVELWDLDTPAAAQLKDDYTYTDKTAMEIIDNTVCHGTVLAAHLKDGPWATARGSSPQNPYDKGLNSLYNPSSAPTLAEARTIDNTVIHCLGQVSAMVGVIG